VVVSSEHDQIESPTALREAVANSLVAEFTTVRDSRPATVPLTPFYDEKREVVVATASPAFADKASRAAVNANVGMLLHGSDGPIHLTGAATVRDDDLEANAARVEQLIKDEPPSQKREVLLETTEFLKTRLGQLLLDWYSLRIVIEIDPISVVPGSATTTAGVRAWPTANIDEREAQSYDKAVVTVVDTDNWPQTWLLDESAFDDGPLRLTPPDGVSLTDGQPACVLCHGFSHDLQNITQRLLRGRVRERTDGFGFDPASSHRLRNETKLDFVRFVVDGKRQTKRYFQQRCEAYSVLPGLETLLRWGDD